MKTFAFVPTTATTAAAAAASYSVVVLLLLFWASTSIACEYDIGSAASLGEYTTIAVAIENLECAGDENDTFQVPSGVNFNLFVGDDSATTQISTSAPDMIIPYVDDSGVLRFKWNKDRPLEVMNDDGVLVPVNDEEAGIRIIFPAVGVTTIETSTPTQQGGSDKNTLTRFVSINAGFGDLSEVINNDATYIRILHGGDKFTQAYPEFPPKNITVRNTGSAGDVELDSAMGVTLDVTGSAVTGRIKADSISGSLNIENGDFKLLSSSQLSVDLAGTFTLLFVDSRTPGGCAGVSNTSESSTCEDGSEFNFDVETVSCIAVTGLTDVVCGSGVPDSGGFGVKKGTFLHIVVPAVMLYLSWK